MPITNPAHNARCGWGGGSQPTWVSWDPVKRVCPVLGVLVCVCPWLRLPCLCLLLCVFVHLTLCVCACVPPVVRYWGPGTTRGTSPAWWCRAATPWASCLALAGECSVAMRTTHRHPPLLPSRCPVSFWLAWPCLAMPDACVLVWRGAGTPSPPLPWGPGRCRWVASWVACGWAFRVCVCECLCFSLSHCHCHSHFPCLLSVR
jgi:hypothetical protein